MEHQRRHQHQQADDHEVLEDCGIPIGNAIVAKRIQERDDQEIDEASRECEPLDRCELRIDGTLRRRPQRQHDVQYDVDAEQQQRKLQLPSHQAIDRQRRNRERRRQRNDAEDQVPGVVETHPG